MVYLLRKDGLPGKYISIIISLSLFIILSFPISMERFGRGASLMIYVMLLAAMTVYLIKARVGSFTVLTAPGMTSGCQTQNVASLECAIPVTKNTNDLASTINVIEKSEAANSINEDNHSQPIQEESSNEVPMPDEIESDEVSRSVVLKEDQENLPDDAPEVIDQKPDEVSEVPEELKAITDPCEMVEEIAEEAGVDIEERQSLVTITAGDNQPINNDSEAPIIADAQLLVEQQDNDSEEPESTDDTLAGVEEILAQQSEAECQTELVEPSPVVLAPGFSDAATGLEEKVMEQVSPVPSGTEVLEPRVSEEAVINLIDYAFACRSTNLAEAARYFEEAWHLTSDYELKYLLTVELVEIYKDNGWYKKAVSMLDSFIALPDHKSDIINEISRQFDYISLLAAELKRLGISDLPVSRVPRWVRLKVNAEMNPPGV